MQKKWDARYPKTRERKFGNNRKTGPLIDHRVICSTREKGGLQRKKKREGKSAKPRGGERSQSNNRYREQDMARVKASFDHICFSEKERTAKRGIEEIPLPGTGKKRRGRGVVGGGGGKNFGS